MKQPRMAMSIADETTRHSQQLIEEMYGRGSRRAANAGRVAAVCKDFILAEPVQPLVARRISEVGRAKYGAFPAPQTLLNHYASILRIWKQAFNQVIDVRVPKATGSQHSDGPIARPNYAILVALAREQKAEIDRLTRIIKENIRIDSSERVNPSQAPGNKIELIRQWVDAVRLVGGPLEVTEQGISVTRKAYPGSIVMRSEVFKCIEGILSTYDL